MSAWPTIQISSRASAFPDCSSDIRPGFHLTDKILPRLRMFPQSCAKWESDPQRRPAGADTWPGRLQRTTEAERRDLRKSVCSGVFSLGTQVTIEHQGTESQRRVRPNTHHDPKIQVSRRQLSRCCDERQLQTHQLSHTCYDVSEISLARGLPGARLTGIIYI